MPPPLRQLSLKKIFGAGTGAAVGHATRIPTQYADASDGEGPTLTTPATTVLAASLDDDSGDETRPRSVATAGLPAGLHVATPSIRTSLVGRQAPPGCKMDSWYWVPRTVMRPELLSQLLVPRKGTGRFAKAPLDLCERSQPGYWLVPRYWGLHHFGPVAAADDKTTDGAPMADGVAFTGQLKNTVEQPQVEIVRRLTQHLCDPMTINGATFTSPCGSGKTVDMLATLVHLKRRAAIVLPKLDLLRQTEDRIQAYVPDAKIGYIWGKKREIDGCDFVLVSLQTVITPHFAEEVRNDTTLCYWLRTIGVVWVDELHHMAADCFVRLFRYFPARWVGGQTATFRRKDGAAHVLEWFMGPHLFKVVRKHDAVTVWRLHANTGVVDVTRGGDVDLAAQQALIARDPQRNVLLLTILLRLLGGGSLSNALVLPDPGVRERQILVLVYRRFHAEVLLRLLSEELGPAAGTVVDQKHWLELAGGTCPMVTFLGGVPDKLKSELNQKRLAARVIFATSLIAREGLDQDRLDTLVFGAPETDIEQPVGRIERAHPTKAAPVVVDVVDTGATYTRRIAQGRRRFYHEGGCAIVYKKLDLDQAGSWFSTRTKRAHELASDAEAADDEKNAKKRRSSSSNSSSNSYDYLKNRK